MPVRWRAFKVLKFFTPCGADITGVGKDYRFFTMHQIYRCGHVGDVIHPPRFGIDADVGLGAKVIWPAFAGVPHLGTAGVRHIFDRNRCGNEGGIHPGALDNLRPLYAPFL